MDFLLSAQRIIFSLFFFYVHGVRFFDTCKSLTEITWVHNISGKEMVIIGQYTFCCSYRSKSTDHWICSANNVCRARVVVTKERKVVRANTEHCHPPPKFIIKDGIFYRLPSH